MIKPTLNELNEKTGGEYNRYEIALATAKCARMITNEYVRQRTDAEASMTGNKETDKPLNTMIDREVRDEKAVKIAIGRIYNGDYRITHKSIEEQEQAERAILESTIKRDDELYIEDRPLDEDEDDQDTAEDAEDGEEINDGIEDEENQDEDNGEDNGEDDAEDEESGDADETEDGEDAE